MKHPLICFMLIPCALLLGAPDSNSSPPFTYSISVPQESFVLGEPISVTITLQNTTATPQTIASWRGPLSGVGKGRTDYDFAVYHIEGSETNRIEYRGMSACGPVSYMTLPPHGKWQARYVINDLRYPAYTFNDTGQYELRSTYFGHADDANPTVFAGTISSTPVIIHIQRLTEDQLRRRAESLSSTNHTDIAILAMHGYSPSVPHMSGMLASCEQNDRKIMHKALAIIGTDAAIHALGDAIPKESNPSQRIEIIRLLRDSKNRIAIQYLEEALADPYTTRIGIGDEPTWYNQYTVRKWAKSSLLRFGITNTTEHLVEIEQDPNTNLEPISGSQ